jgi:hypothetical protein
MDLASLSSEVSPGVGRSPGESVRCCPVSTVRMPVVQVGIVRMPVHHRHMAMAVRMSLVRRLAGRMLVLMMFIVNVAVLMRDRLVHVLMAVPFRQMQVKADRHQAARRAQRPGDRFPEKNGPDERRDREIGACPCRPEVAQGCYEQDEADA